MTVSHAAPDSVCIVRPWKQSWRYIGQFWRYKEGFTKNTVCTSVDLKNPGQRCSCRTSRFRFSIDPADRENATWHTADSKTPLSARGPRREETARTLRISVILVFSPVFLGVRDKHGDVTVSRPIKRPHGGIIFTRTTFRNSNGVCNTARRFRIRRHSFDDRWKNNKGPKCLARKNKHRVDGDMGRKRFENPA